VSDEAAMIGNSAVLKFSTDDYPERDKVSLWREHFGRAVVKTDFIPALDKPFRSVSYLRTLPDLKIWSCSITECAVERTPSLVADGDDDFVFAIVKKGRSRSEQGGREALFGDGEAILWSAEVAGSYRNLSFCEITALSLPRRTLTSTVADVDRALMKAIPASNEALRLLVDYVNVLSVDATPMMPELEALSVSHIHDLVTLSLGATRDAGETAKMGGLRAARLRAIKRDIVENLAERSLSMDFIATRHTISSRYIRALFEEDQTTFTDFVREQRLRLAYRMLSDAVFVDRSVSAIAFDSGFGDISYFNQIFRRRFGVTPSDVRKNARDQREADRSSEFPE
jgi:AraC-like DNA-binding protein